ncbi:hypothetical protein LP417_33900 (plasmid) [Polaromonas sp. P1-6]|nr:hypothetical protein LP417_33900 [Polaromonas sp. P1-6]
MNSSKLMTRSLKKKERAALLLEQAKDGDLDPATKKSADAALSAQASRAAAEALKKEAAAAASVIKVNAIIGIEGRRVVQGSIGGRTMAMNEGSGDEKHGWKLTSIHGHCADFEKLAGAQDPAQKPAGSSKKRATQSGNQSDEKLTARTQTSCFSLAAAAPTTMQAGSAVAQRTVPVPVPLPGFASIPQPFSK